MHYAFRDSVDSHNARRQAPISLEQTWGTGRWPNRVFAYLLATSEVNATLGEAEFGDAQHVRPQLDFRRLLAKDLIYNPYLAGSTNPRNMAAAANTSHKLVTLPRGKKFSGANIVDSKSDYPFNYCHCRIQRVRTYCRCMPGVLLCPTCFTDHCIDIDINF